MMNENENETAGWSAGVPSVLSADFNNGDQSAQPPSIAQAFLRGLLGRIEERGHELQQTYEDTGITEDDPAMERYMLATQHLHVAQQTAISLSAPLAMAEHHLEGFKAAVDNTHENAVETALVGVDGAVQRDPFQLLRDLLTENKKNANQAYAKVLTSNFWNAGISKKYANRAELLESNFDENGDERAVMVLLEADTAKAERAFEETSSEDVGPCLSGAGDVHRTAMLRLFKLRNTIRDIPGLEI